MPENPLQAICQTFERVSKSVQTQATQLLIGLAHRPASPTNQQHEHRLFSLSSSPSLYNSNSSGSTLNQSTGILNMETSATPVTKEELGRATWTLLHTLAAQYPDKPTRQQKKDVKELMGILSRIYPCKECADHFKEVLRANPVQAGSQGDFSQWLCHVHNIVNRSLGKLVFPCERVDARWGKLECEQRACDLQGITTNFGKEIR